MDIQTQEIYSEVYSLLKLLGENYIKKLPVDLFEMIGEERNKNYNPRYNWQISLEKQKIKKETLSMIALLHINYWCNSDKEKSELQEIFKTNEEKYQEEIREKYNPDNIFKSLDLKQEKKTTEMIIIKEKKSFIERLLNKIKNIFCVNK